MYADLLVKDVNGFDQSQYSDENWTMIETLRDNAIATLATASADAAKGIYEAAITEIKAVQKQIVIKDALEYFDLEVWHNSGDYEHIIRFKPKNGAQAVTLDNRVSELSGIRANGNAMNLTYATRTVGDININKKYPSYYESTGYYGFALGFGYFSLNAKNEIYFVVQTDAGEYYAFHFYVTVTTKDPSSATVEFVREKYLNTPENFGLLKGVYLNETWTTITGLYTEFTAALAEGVATSKLQEYIDAANAIEMDGIVAIDAATKKTWTVTGDEKQDFATNGALIDNNYKNGWQLNSKEDGRYYLITLDQAYDLLAFYIKWEGANAAEYDVMVSEDGVDFRLAGSFATSPKQAEREDQFALKDATNVRYVMIVMHVPGSNYNYQAREIDLFIAK